MPEAQHEAARAQGRARFEQFIQQLARHLQRGHSLVRDLHEEIFPDESEFFGRDATLRHQRIRSRRMSLVTALPNPAVTAGERRTRMLRTAMGPAIAAALEDPEVVEILLNPDGTLWLDRLGTGRAPTGITLSAQDAERIIRVVAAQVRRRGPCRRRRFSPPSCR